MSKKCELQKKGKKEMSNYQDVKQVYSLCEWINPVELDWSSLSSNPNAIALLESNPELIDWCALSGNPNASHLLKKNPGNIHWPTLCTNPDSTALQLLKEDPRQINWYILSGNPSAYAIELLTKNPEKINWFKLSQNTHPDACILLHQHPEKINWHLFSKYANKNSISFLKEYKHKIHWHTFSENKHLNIHDIFDTDDIVSYHDWRGLSINPSNYAIKQLQQNPEQIIWFYLSQNINPKAIQILEQNTDKIDFYWFASNTSGVELITKLIHSHYNLIEWYLLSENINAVPLLQQHPDKIYWPSFSANPNIFTINYTFLKERMHNTGLFEELMSNRFHPDNIHNFDGWGFELSWNC